MPLYHLFVVYFLVSELLSTFHAYEECKFKETEVNRVLHIITCETLGNDIKPRYKSIGFLTGDPLKLWNISSIPLRNENKATMLNVCGGLSWELGVLTKTLYYHQHVNSLISSSTRSGDQYVLLMDSDTLWSAESITDIWRRYDCVRKQAEVVISSELTCSMGGFYCTPDTIAKWYPNVSYIDSPSSFLNSGVIMGKASVVNDMLDYIITHNMSYYSYHAYDKKRRFHDQHAVSDYVLRVALKGLFVIDYYQQLSGSFGIRLPSAKPTKSKFVCKRYDGSIDYHCEDKTTEIAHLQPKYFHVNASTCAVYRQAYIGQVAYEQLQLLAPDPAVWHGNGGAKKVFVSLGREVHNCMNQRFHLQPVSNP